MEIQVNNMILKNSFLLNTHGRQIFSSNNGHYLFVDGSEVDLNLGIIVTDTKNNSPQAFTLHILPPGKQTFSTGIKNENPTTKSWTVNRLDINYGGGIIVSPSKTNQITVEENETCFASEENGTIYITPADYTTVTIDTVRGSITNITNGVRQPLKITAPIDTIITNRSGSLAFFQVDQIILVGGDIDGTKANTITGITDNRTTISILDLGSLNLETTSALTLNIGFANRVNLKSDSRVEINVTKQIGELTVNNESTTNITGGNYQNLTIEKSGGALNIKRFQNIENLTISAGSSVEVTGSTVKELNIKKTGSRVTINIDDCKTFTSDKTGSVSIKGKNLRYIEVNNADSRVDIETERSESVRVGCKSAVNIKGNQIERIYVSGNSRVDILAKTLKDVTVFTSSAVNVSCDQGDQVIVIKTSSRVDLKIATAKQVTVTTNSAVAVSAYTYLTNPVIQTNSRINVEKRK